MKISFTILVFYLTNTLAMYNSKGEISSRQEKKSEKNRLQVGTDRRRRFKGSIKKELFPTGTAKEKEVYEKRNGGASETRSKS